MPGADLPSDSRRWAARLQPVCHFCYPNRTAIKLLKTSKQICQQLHQMFTKGEVRKRELKDHNKCTCFQGKRYDPNPVCCFFSMRCWRLGSESPFPYPVHVGLHTFWCLKGIRDEKNLWENDQMTAVSSVSNLSFPKCMEFFVCWLSTKEPLPSLYATHWFC